MEYALLSTTLAGLATAVGGMVAVLRTPSKRFMAACMGFAAGIMVGIGLMDMLPEALAFYATGATPVVAAFRVVSLMLVGMAVASLLGGLLPEALDAQALSANRSAILRSAVVTGMALLLHNLPEGVLTLFAALSDPQIGIRMALAVGLHNLPEGIAVAAPLYFATGSRRKAVLAALAAGIAEPIGAVLAFLVAGRFLTPAFLNGLLALVAGIMCWVSVFELLPTGFGFEKRGHTAMGFGVGVAVMLLGIGVLS